MGLGRLGFRPRIRLGVGLGIVESLGLGVVSVLGLAAIRVQLLESVVWRFRVRLRLSVLKFVVR
jgi:hypothetical protein